MSDIESTEFLRLMKVCFDLSANVLRHYTHTQLIKPEYGSSVICFLDKNKHMFYHLWQTCIPCCECTVSIKPRQKEMFDWMFRKLYYMQKGTRCSKPQTKMDTRNGCMQKHCICRILVVPTATLEELDINTLTFLLKRCFMSNTDVESINSVRGKLCHAASTTSFAKSEYDQIWQDLKSSTLSLAKQIDQAFYSIIEEHLKMIEKIDMDKDEIMQLLSKNQLMESSNQYAQEQEIQKLATGFAENLSRIALSTDDLKKGQNVIKQDLKRTGDESKEGNQAIRKELKEIKHLISVTIGEYKKRIKCINTEVTLNISPVRIEPDSEQLDRTDINIKVDCDGLNEDEAISRLTDGKGDEKPSTFQISNAEKMCILLHITAGPDVFQNEETFKDAIDNLIDRIIDAGEIDTNQNKTMKIELTFQSPISDEQRAVVYNMLSRYGKLYISYKSNDTEIANALKETSSLGINTNERDMESKTVQITPNCEPCEYMMMDVKANYFCEDCEEMYCKTCMQKHSLKKKMANHNIIVVDGMLTDTHCCGPCLYKGLKAEACHICKNCDEYLCAECCIKHVAQTRNKDHLVETIIRCENCSDNGYYIKASFYCTKCEEPMCDECADDHRAMKKTKIHTLETNLISYLKSQNQSDIKVAELTDSTDRRSSGAIPKILTSKVKKILTMTLGLQVLQGKLQRSICGQCSVANKRSDALFVCEDCDEQLCEECKNYHTEQSDNKNHQVYQLSKDDIFCFICKSQHSEVPATCYCTACSELKPYCDLCAKQHITMKATRDHNFSGDLRYLRRRLQKQTTPPRLDESKEEVTKIHDNTRQIPVESLPILGKPHSTTSKSDNLDLQWRSEINLSKNESYQILYKELPNGRWITCSRTKASKEPYVNVDGLKADTSYVFKVRIIDDQSGKEGPFSVESDPIQTKRSPAVQIIQISEQISRGPPAVYILPMKENKSARHVIANTRKFVLGKEANDLTEKTIMLVGGTGSGKSTLINGMANYIMGVAWEDPFRFDLSCLETSDVNQAHSQTKGITCYTLHNDVTDRVNYTINLIDTPGFGDTRGLDQDALIVEQIRQLFTAYGENGVATLDAVCFILKAPDSRLTATQIYIFESILSLFGNDIKDNVCTLITFADGHKPPVLAAIQALDSVPLPYDTYFTFNNSALFMDNTVSTSSDLSAFFWNMGITSCQKFFNHLNTLKTKSLTLTSEVLLKRQKLETTIKNLLQEIDLGLSKINILEKEFEIFSLNTQSIFRNENFEYDVEEDFPENYDITGSGQFTTTCMTCNYTCHENCVCAQDKHDKEKARCCVMNKEGNCSQCPRNCHWSQHRNVPYIRRWTKRKVTKRYDDMKKKYEEAAQKTLTQEQVLEEMNQEMSAQEQSIHVMMEVIAKLKNRLKEIALRPDPLSTVQYIDLLIASEELEKKRGFESRIKALYKCKQRAQYGKSVQIFKDRIRNTRETIAASDVADLILKDDKSVMARIKGFFGWNKNELKPSR